jgi:hypothetical protein
MARVRSKLTSVAGLTGMLPMPFAMELGRPGDGNHIGCTSPCRVPQWACRADVLGRVRWLTAGSRGGRIRLSTIPANYDHIYCHGQTPAGSRVPLLI